MDRRVGGRHGTHRTSGAKSSPRGGPGFSSDVVASVIYKQYQAGFYGLSTAGNVILFIVVAAVIMPLQYFLTRRTVES